MASLNEIKRIGKRHYRRIGRGQGSKRGKQSGRGGKGQTARAGHKIRPALRDIIKKLPKRRGYGKNRARTVFADRPKPTSVPLARIESQFDAGAFITPKELKEKGLISARTHGPIKVIGNELSKKLSFSGVVFSGSAKAAVEKSGGSVA